MDKKFIEFKTEEEYKEAKRKHDLNSSVSETWRKENKTNGIPKEVYSKFPYANEVTNELRSAIEHWEFIHNIPNKYFLYVKVTDGYLRGIATTWTGQKLGDISFGNEYYSNFGDKRQSITVYAINGKTYYGTYFNSAGDYARIRIKK